jgi:hypothetical protein
MDRRTTRSGLSPFARKTVRHASAATIRSFVPGLEPSRCIPEGGKDRKTRTSGSCRGLGACFFSQQRRMGHRTLASTRGSCGAGGRAFRGLTRAATEWSAARRKPLRAAAMHLRAAISADVKARRLPTSGRRKFPSGNFRSARDLRKQRGSTLGRRVYTPAPSPFASKRGPSHLFVIDAGGSPWLPPLLLR